MKDERWKMWYHVSVLLYSVKYVLKRRRPTTSQMKWKNCLECIISVTFQSHVTQLWQSFLLRNRNSPQATKSEELYEENVQHANSIEDSSLRSEELSLERVVQEGDNNARKTCILVVIMSWEWRTQGVNWWPGKCTKASNPQISYQIEWSIERTNNWISRRGLMTFMMHAKLWYLQ